MGTWGMNLDGHVPSMGQKLDPGKYLVEVAQTEDDTTDKGNRINVTFRVVEGDNTGGTIRSVLYIIDDDFAGSDGHRAATLDNWYHLLVAVGQKPSNYTDMRKVADMMVGRRLGIEVKNSKPTGPEGKIYANVQSYFPAAAISTTVSDDDVDLDDLT